jgi:hypothetical protein
MTASDLPAGDWEAIQAEVAGWEPLTQEQVATWAACTASTTEAA